MTNGGYIFWSVIGGAIAGGIGAGVSENSDSPILKGALVVGLLNGVTSAFFASGVTAQKQLQGSGTVSGLQKEWGL